MGVAVAGQLASMKKDSGVVVEKRDPAGIVAGGKEAQGTETWKKLTEPEPPFSTATELCVLKTSQYSPGERMETPLVIGATFHELTLGAAMVTLVNRLLGWEGEPPLSL